MPVSKRLGSGFRNVNRTFYELTGYSTDEALVRSPRFLQGPLADRGTHKSLRDPLRAGKTSETTMTIETAHPTLMH